MNQIVTTLLFLLMAVVGGGSTIVIVGSLPLVIIWKIYRSIRYGYKITD